MDETILAKAKNLLRLESKAVLRCAERLDESFERAVRLIQDADQSGRKLILTGVGKSHYVAAKLAASFTSTGLTALFLHPAEAFHGDLGVLREGDVVVLFTKSGSTPELVALMSIIRGRNKVIAITGNVESPLAREADVVLDASIEKEACPINLLPTASTTVALAMGDALVSTVAEHRGFTRETFAGFHPGGSLGKRLNAKVGELMTPLEKIASGTGDTALKDVAQAMTDKPFGAYCVLDAKQKITGIIVEGDLRRAFAKGIGPDTLAKQIMTAKPVYLSPTMIAEDALALMDRPRKRITTAPVLSDDGVLLGLIHLHDLV